MCVRAGPAAATAEAAQSVLRLYDLLEQPRPPGTRWLKPMCI